MNSVGNPCRWLCGWRPAFVSKSHCRTSLLTNSNLICLWRFCNALVILWMKIENWCIDGYLVESMTDDKLLAMWLSKMNVFLINLVGLKVAKLGANPEGSYELSVWQTLSYTTTIKLSNLKNPPPWYSQKESHLVSNFEVHGFCLHQQSDIARFNLIVGSFHLVPIVETFRR